MLSQVVNMAGIDGQLAPEWWSTSTRIYIQCLFFYKDIAPKGLVSYLIILNRTEILL
jgi:hypothetical protein